jgi:hypothetical protein
MEVLGVVDKITAVKKDNLLIEEDYSLFIEIGAKYCENYVIQFFFFFFFLKENKFAMRFECFADNPNLVEFQIYRC